MTYHPMITIEIDKSYPIRKYQAKLTPDKVLEKLRVISEDKMGWSKKVMDAVQSIIISKTLDLPYDLFEVHKNISNSINYRFDKDLSQITQDQIKQIMRKELDSEEQQISQTIETYLQNKDKYQELDDIHTAQLIILLSELSKMSEKIWVSITFQLREIKSAIFYFRSEDGHIALSERSRIQDRGSISQYIQSMNELIDHKRPIPGIEEEANG